MPSRSLLALLLGIGLLIALGAVGTAAALGALYRPGPPYAESALQWSTPDPWSGPHHDQYMGMTRFTAEELNRSHQGARWGPITFVSDVTPSTRPDMVSVNPIDDYTWGAAAYSVRSHRCYLILSVGDPENPRHGSTFYGSLPGGSPCVGASVNASTAAAKAEPRE